MVRINKKYTVITGASQGLGKSLANVCARRGLNLLLIALPGEGVRMLAAELGSKYTIDAIGYEADLTCVDQLKELINWINKRLKINILINNAGVGGSRQFQDAPLAYIDNIMLLNVRALVMLTHGLLPNLKKQDQGYILNIASLASFGPIPFKTVYPASKAFVYSFSRGLYAELKDSNVFVSVAHPGGMATNPDVTRRINQYNRLIRSTILSPDKIAEKCLSQLLKKDPLIIPGYMNKLSWVFLKTCPVWLRLILFKRSLSRELNTQNIISYA